MHTVIPGSSTFPYWTIKWTEGSGEMCKFIEFDKVQTLEIRGDLNV